MATARATLLLIGLAACAGGSAPPRAPGATAVDAAVAESNRLRLAARWDEAGRRVDRALAAAELSREDAVRLLVERASIEREVGWFRRRAATAESERTLARAEAMVSRQMSPRTRAAVAEARGWLIYWRGFDDGQSFDQALPFFAEARRLREAAGDRAGLASSWFEIGLVHQQTNRLEPAKDAFLRGHAIASAERLPVELAYLERHLGATAEMAGDLDAAGLHYRRSLELREQAGHEWGVVFACIALADFEGRRGERAAAAALLDRAAALAARLDLAVGEASVAEARAALARADDRPDEACRQMQAALRAWNRYGHPPAIASARERAAEWACPPAGSSG
jgi:tetratricopeptide (TPR) repeat protein